jgi:epoxyqueuosine reductase
MNGMKHAASLMESMKRTAIDQGIDVLGFADASEFPDYPSNPSRQNPALSLPGARTIVIAGIYIGGCVLPGWDDFSMGRTSRLFLSGFFLDIVKPLLPLSDELRRNGYSARICDDSSNQGSIAPLKLAAVRAGMGWQGKNSLLITREYGSFLALGGIITDADLRTDVMPEKDHCGTCSKCRLSCPMHALDREYCLDKHRCLSYLLQMEPVSDEIFGMTQNRVQDCEICQEACPWNEKHIRVPLSNAMTRSFQKKIDHWEKFFTLQRLAVIPENEYTEILGALNTGIPYRIFHRNVLKAADYYKGGQHA